MTTPCASLTTQAKMLLINVQAGVAFDQYVHTFLALYVYIYYIGYWLVIFFAQSCTNKQVY